ncbi:MAG: glutamate synthase subunit alpha [Paenibacillaceae bacterium]|jgi:glutamate synthase (ferredoxin)|nr:glutamate synthase subunit alpha [Paenibacillaceae bacterium]
MNNQPPVEQGLYDPKFEHDACGIGFIAHIQGQKSHKIVSDALAMLDRLAHRGGQGADEDSGDGAGILTQIPHDLFADWCGRHAILLPSPGKYGVGMLFLPADATLRARCEELAASVVSEEGCAVLGWRTVPTREEALGPSAFASKPLIRQLFVAPLDTSSPVDELALERKLYVIRKRIEQEWNQLPKEIGSPTYFASLSCRTIVYKGLLLPHQIPVFFPDLQEEKFTSALALVHSRFSTNTFPSWERAHPNRYAIHNGEINTIKGNVNWMRAREAKFASGLFPDMSKVLPVIDDTGSDSSMLDNALEFLLLSGRTLPHAVMMMVPEPWSKDPLMDEKKKAFYEYHSCLMEPWDGPSALVFSDGRQICACLDRNGLRPARYYVTNDDRIVLSSEVGVIDIPDEAVRMKGRLSPGKMLLVDTSSGRIIPDEEVKSSLAGAFPYQQWVDEGLVGLDQLPEAPKRTRRETPQQLAVKQRIFGYTFEELHKTLKPLAEQGDDPVGSMGYDGPLAVLSNRPQLLYSYFKQMFAQVTNPPIDASLEEMVTSLETTIGRERNLLAPSSQSCRRIRLKAPVLRNDELAKIVGRSVDGLKAVKLSILYQPTLGGEGIDKALRRMFQDAEQAIAEGAAVLVLTDRGANKNFAPIPALLALAGLHHHLIRCGKRTDVSLLVESGEPREVHHIALLLGYGASAVNPYLAFESIDQLCAEGKLGDVTPDEAADNYVYGVSKGILKIMAKMGISTVQSYIGAQIFEAVGISLSVVDTYFCGTSSRIGGIGLDTISRETAERHKAAYRPDSESNWLASGDDFQWRSGGEVHLFSPKMIHTLQQACRTGNYRLFKEYSQEFDEQTDDVYNLRGLLEFVESDRSIPLEDVEPIESLLRRFKSGAMSFGSISKEAHETLAIAMNRIGGRSNSGEGGEDPARYVRDDNGDSRSSAIKQVASGRFGVTSHYLTNAEEIQIKMAQGAKPGEGGQLPAHKVYPWIAKVRGSTPGVELISPPPHHDIYSIEDLAELIFDLKNANPLARINVKLVSVAGVGTIAAGVAKASADVILISGYDGGTGAAPRTSIKHTGMPWEIGLAEAHQTLVLNGLRNRVRLETDGKMMTGRDVVIAAMLGAEEFGFATLPLVAMGCVMMRVCHLDTCPVGIATQNPELRAKFPGEPEHVEHFMRFIAEEVREWMARLGVRSLDELIGRTDLLKMRDLPDSRKAAAVDLSRLLYLPNGQPGSEGSACFCSPQNHRLEDTLDQQQLLAICEPLWSGQAKEIKAILPIQNKDRTVGTTLGSEVTRRFGANGLPEDSIQLHFRGSAGQSFGAFVPAGISLSLEGDANDYIGKGLSGGKIAVFPSPKSLFAPENNVIVGNVAFYGATSGEAYIRGMAGERFCVRNSGANVVVEGVGNHGCEYMTGGKVAILGGIGKNFAAGMSGGIAYIWGPDKERIAELCNMKMIELERLEEREEIRQLYEMIVNHVKYTQSELGKQLLTDWKHAVRQFVRVIPREYKRIIQMMERGGEHGEADRVYGVSSGAYAGTGSASKN